MLPTSDSPVPPYVDTRKVFQQEGGMSGKLSLDRMPGLLECLASDEGLVTIELRFEVNDSRRRVIRGSLQAKLQVTCQRCLEALAIELQDDIELTLVKDQEAAEALDDKLEPWICEDHKLDIARLAEEQLMLCLPIVSYHPNPDCLARLNYKAPGLDAKAAESEPKDNPFSVLKALKGND